MTNKMFFKCLPILGTIAFSTGIVSAQTFDNLNSNIGTGKSVQWNTVTGFGHKIYNVDMTGGLTHLRFASLNNGAWSDGMVLTSNNRLGIGTATPAYTLDVNGDIQTAHNLFFNYVGQGNGLIAGDAAGSVIFSLTRSAGNDVRLQTYGKLLFTNGDNNGYERMRIDEAGNVGIGMAPTVRLDVSGNIRANNSMIMTNVGTGNGITADDGAGSTIFSIKRQASNETRFQSYGPITFFTQYSNGTEKMRIDENGNVGIGMTPSATTTYKLSVEGKIGAREIQVLASGWPDYVFEDAYKLKPLSEIAQYIKSNKHLPGIPTVVDVKEQGGIEVGVMQTRLLEKVEELTLYVIQQNQQILDLQKRINSVESKK